MLVATEAVLALKLEFEEWTQTQMCQFQVEKLQSFWIGLLID